MKSIYLFLTISFSILSFGQAKKDYTSIDKKISDIPRKLTVSTDAIAQYISANFKTDEEKIRAVFYWTASNIDYDVNKKFTPNSKETSVDKIMNTLKTHKGVCANYTEIFNAIANKVGIQTVIISGLTKQYGIVNAISHAWCGSNIEGKWYVFDPTWGSGYVEKRRFFRKINNYYFKANPKEIIFSHMPYDYMWQFLNYPITNEEFYNGKPQINRLKKHFDFETEIFKYNTSTELEKWISSTKRIESNGVKNPLLFERLAYNKKQIEYSKRSDVVDEFNSILGSYKEAVDELNDFISYRNRQFRPANSDAELKKMIAEPCNKLIRCQELLNNLGFENEKYISNLASVKKSLNEAIKMAKEHETFVFAYLSKSKKVRETLFYRAI